MSKYENPFVLKAEEYKRDIQIVDHYREQIIHHLMVSTKQPRNVCEDFVKRKIMTRLVDTKMKLLERGENGDREKKIIPFTQFLSRVIREEQIMVPTFTTYISPKKKKSVIASIMEFLVKRRSAAKKEMFNAEQIGDEVTRQNKEGEQGALKRNANALSGAQGSRTNVFSNKSAHSTLTSNCRATSGYGNVNNEKMLGGNRIYWHYEIAIANINAILVRTNLDQLDQVMQKYQLHYPTQDETMECVLYSLRLYTRSTVGFDRIRDLIDNLSPVQRAAFVYTGDLYHLKKYNDAMMRQFITEIITRVEEPCQNKEFVEGINNDAQKVLAKLINFKYFSQPHLLKKKMDDIKKESLVEYEYYLSTLENLYNTCIKYSDFIKVFLVTDNMPNSVAQLPNAPRRVVLASDTDSTIFTLQDWVKWYCGRIEFGDVANRVSDGMVFLASQTIVHLLAKMSANFGVVTERIFQISMKNEFKFDIFSPTPEAKHYYAGISSQEGIIKDKLKMEIKGVNLINSNIPESIMGRASDLMEDIVNTVYRNEKINVTEILHDIGDIEHSILQSIMKGGNDFFRRAQVKSQDAYKNGADNTAIVQCDLWNSVFSDKYSFVSVPPYDTIKASVTLDSPTEVKAWLDKVRSIGSNDIADKVEQWLAKRGRKYIGTTIWVPTLATSANGIPKEIILAISTRSLIRDLTGVFYMILKTLGIHMDNNNITRLIMDTHGRFERTSDLDLLS